MHRYDPARQKLALGLAFLAGQVDATGFVVAGGYFTSFMSGNTTRLGVDLVARPALALIPLAIIACFVCGVVAGAMVAVRMQGRHKRVLLAGIAVLLALAALALGQGSAAGFLALAAAAMGAANNVFSRDGEVTVGVTYMTGALVRFGQGVAAQLSGRSDVPMRGYGLLWCALAAGATAGAALHAASPALAPALASALAALLCALAMAIERRDFSG